MKLLSILMLLSTFLLSSCYDTAYNPDYIISDTTMDASDIKEVEED